MHFDPVEPTLKAPGNKRLKQPHDEALSSFAFKFNLRRYSMAQLAPQQKDKYKVRRCRLTLSSPCCNRLELSA